MVNINYYETDNFICVHGWYPHWSPDWRNDLKGWEEARWDDGFSNAFNRNNETGRGDGGYIDFHYEGSTLDYTSRIVENNYGVINIMSPNGLLINGASLADFVVQQGQSGSWMIRKWDSGIAECWRKISGTITDSGTWNNFRIFSGSADFPSNFFISSPNVQYCCYLGSGYAINARGVLSTTTKFNWSALGTDGDSNISYIVDCYAIGKWK